MEEKAIKLVKAMAAMQREGTLCDVTLQAEQKTIQAHKVILAGGSPYFTGMFGGSFIETDYKEVTFQEITFTGLKAVVDEIYCKDIDISVEDLVDVLHAAHLFQVENLVDSVSSLMADNVNSDNCFRFLENGHKYQLDQVFEAALQFIPAHFPQVDDKKELYQVSKEDICGILSSDVLCTYFREIDVYNTAKKWLEVQKIKDSELIADVIKNVRFALISPEMLSEIREDDILHANTECQQLIEEARKYHYNVNTQSFYGGNLNKARGLEGIVMFPPEISSGEGRSLEITFETFPDHIPARTKMIPSLEVFPECRSLKMVKVNNFLFVFAVETATKQNFTKRYDAAMDTWLDMSPIPGLPRVQFATAYCPESIFIIGGMEQPIESQEKPRCTNDTYRYSIADDTWTKCDDMPYKYYESAAAHLNGVIYFNGGHFERFAMGSRNLYAFDTKMENWAKKGSMCIERAGHILEAVSDKLYAMGGAYECFEGTMEVYDPVTDRWGFVPCYRLLQETRFSYFGSTSFVHDHKIYIVGGNTPGVIVEFDPDEETLETTEHKIPDGLRHYRCAAMTLPKLF